jgi:flagellar motor protein MotB
MVRRPKPDEPPPSKAYLVSFGDTMTALLAFFIVLLSLADEQTGADLYSGTGSFVKAINGIGLPGTFSGNTSAHPVQRQAESPRYLADDLEDRPPEPTAVGPDENNEIAVLDREKEMYERFLNELERLNRLQRLPETEGEVVFDLFNKLNPGPPLLTSVHRDALLRVLPTLRQERYRVDLVVWATMPSPSAWTKAGQRASQIVSEISQWANLRPEQQARLRAVGKPWRYADVKRPVISIVVRKLAADK